MKAKRKRSIPKKRLHITLGGLRIQLNSPKKLNIKLKGNAKSKASKRSKYLSSKVGDVMKEFKKGALHSMSRKGPKVNSKKQAIAIGMSEARKPRKRLKKRKKRSVSKFIKHKNLY